MQDLTKLTTPIGLLRHDDPETAAALEAHAKAGGRVAFFNGATWFAIAAATRFDPVLAYRAIPPVRVLDEPPHVPDAVWRVLDPGIVAITQDSSGALSAHRSKPDNSGCGPWWVSNPCQPITGLFPGIRPGKGDWRKMIVRRPEGV